MKCSLTGQPLPPRPEGQRGAPRLYINSRAARCNHRLSELGTLLLELQEGPGFTPEAASRVRAQVFRIGNMVKVQGAPSLGGPTTPFGVRLPNAVIDRLEAVEGAGRSAKLMQCLSRLPEFADLF